MHINDLVKRSIFATFLLNAGITAYWWGEWIALVGVWCMLPVTATIFSIVGGSIMRNLGIEIDMEPADEEEGEPVLGEKIKVNVVAKSKEIIGIFCDTNIHEWLELEDGGTTRKVFYKSCARNENEIPELRGWSFFRSTECGWIIYEEENVQS